MSAAESMQDLPVEVRSLEPDDYALILSSWLRNNEPDDRVDPRVYFKRHEALIKRALAERPEMFRVLVDRSDSSHVFGWICADSFLRVLHFVFVKPAFRRMGFARRLLASALDGAPDFHSHTSSKFRFLKLSSHFDPYAFGGSQ